MLFFFFFFGAEFVEPDDEGRSPPGCCLAACGGGFFFCLTISSNFGLKQYSLPSANKLLLASPLPAPLLLQPE